MAGGYRAGRVNLTSGDSNQARRVISSARGCVILVSAASRSRFVFPPIGGPAFQPLSLAALRKGIRRGRSSNHLPEKLALRAGWSPNWRLAMTATSNVPARSQTFCYRPRCRSEVQPPADCQTFPELMPSLARVGLSTTGTLSSMTKATSSSPLRGGAHNSGVAFTSSCPPDIMHV